MTLLCGVLVSLESLKWWMFVTFWLLQSGFFLFFPFLSCYNYLYDWWLCMLICIFYLEVKSYVQAVISNKVWFCLFLIIYSKFLLCFFSLFGALLNAKPLCLFTQSLLVLPNLKRLVKSHWYEFISMFVCFFCRKIKSPPYLVQFPSKVC